MAPVCVITGATGAVGPRVAEAFLRAGYEVRAVAHRQPAAGVLPGSVEVHVADILDERRVAPAMARADVVVHLAALLHVIPPARVPLSEYERINVGGTAAIVRSAVAAGVRRVVFFSSIAVYGAGRGELDESATTQPDTAYGLTKLEAEQHVLEARDAGGVPVGTVLRLAAVYGSRVKGNYSDLARALAAGHYVPVGAGENRRTLIYDRDVAAAAVFAAAHPAAAGGVFNVTDGSCPRLREIVAAMCDALGRSTPVMHLPAAPVRVAVRTIDRLHRAAGRGSWPFACRVDKYFESICVNGRRFAQLGFSPRFDLRSGWDDAIREMRSTGALTG